MKKEFVGAARMGVLEKEAFSRILEMVASVISNVNGSH